MLKLSESRSQMGYMAIYITSYHTHVDSQEHHQTYCRMVLRACKSVQENMVTMPIEHQTINKKLLSTHSHTL